MKENSCKITLLNCCLACLIIVQVALVCIVAYLSMDSTIQANEINNQIFEILDKQCRDSAAVAINVEDMKVLMSSVVERNKVNIDGNNYIAIILTLLTICLTMATIIPYIVGESITKSKIQEIAQQIYQADMTDQNSKYLKTVEHLDCSEAHTSRMTAYLLQKNAENSAYDVIWSVGWAAKALNRYFRHAQLYQSNKLYGSYNKFFGECRTYISKGLDFFENDDYNDFEKVGDNVKAQNPEQDIAGCYKRAMKDLADAYFYALYSESTCFFDESEKNSGKLKVYFDKYCSLRSLFLPSDQVEIKNLKEFIKTESKWINDPAISNEDKNNKWSAFWKEKEENNETA